MKDNSDPLTLAYSYLRFSDRNQRTGDSLRRQTDGRLDAFLARHKLTLDTTVTLRDLGVSAFRGKHRGDKYALGQFLQAAKDGRIPAGGYTVVENLDRLTREEVRDAFRLWMDILDMKIHITLQPEAIYRHDGKDMIDMITAIVNLQRGHEESRQSDLLTAAWGSEKRRQARNHAILTSNAPAWLRAVGRVKVDNHVKGGEFELIPERAAAVKDLYDRRLKGNGVYLIVKQLTAEGVPPPWGPRFRRWSKFYVHKLLTTRARAGRVPAAPATASRTVPPSPATTRQCPA
ncbi:MAG: recombinase family protein [Gemmataceae bacterium]